MNAADAGVPWRASGPVISIGECMVELARGGDGRFGLAYGGDTFNTAVYLARAGADVAYATALGDDPYSAGILATAKAEHVGTALIDVLPGRNAGLYLIETQGSGERSFWYWRDRAPARELFDGRNAALVCDAIANARLVYFSGVTLSLYNDTALDRFAEALAGARQQGAVIAMDSNYRPRGWGGDIVRARAIFERFWRSSHIGMPTFDDEQALWGDATPAATASRLSDFGVAEIIVKNGAEGALVRAAGLDCHVPCPLPIKPVDTTAAGDSFNAGYLSQRLKGRSPDAAAEFGHRLAGVVIQHRGAIVPAGAMAEVLGRT